MNRAGARFTGKEELRDANLQLSGANMLDFWRWAFSDLRQNDVRGVFSEWLVAKLLNIDPGCRESWAAWDLVTPEGVRIEVKCAAHVQAWHETDRPSRIEWRGLKGRTWDPETGRYSGTRTHNADLYVFCVQTEEDHSRWNGLDLAQWRFYLLPRVRLEKMNVQTLSEKRLQQVARPMDAKAFRDAARSAIAEIARS